jgi:hypothetical protein
MATGPAAAMYVLNPSAFGGAIQPTTTGFAWNLVGVFREPATNRKEVIAGIIVTTLDGDGLLAIRDKLAAGVKAEGLARDFNVVNVAFFQLGTVAV